MAKAYNFGTGYLYGVRTDLSNPTPVQFGVLQDIQLDFSFSNKELVGQYQLPVDVARGQMKIAGKAKEAQIFSSFFDLFFGQGVTSANSRLIANNEAHTPSGTTQVVTNSATFTQDLGVYYASTGVPLVRVASGPTTGQYSVSAGTYTFAAADEVALLFNYEYTASSNNELVLSNQLMGSGPVFSVYLSTGYKSNIANFKLNQCTSEKLSVPFKNTDYTIFEFDFNGYADSANNFATLSFSQ